MLRNKAKKTKNKLVAHSMHVSGESYNLLCEWATFIVTLDENYLLLWIAFFVLDGCPGKTMRMSTYTTTLASRHVLDLFLHSLDKSLTHLFLTDGDGDGDISSVPEANQFQI